MKKLFDVDSIKAARTSLLLVVMLAFLLAFASGCGGSGSGDSGGGSTGSTGSTGGGGGGGGKEITVASNIAYPPFEFNKNGQPTGFDIDLMKAVAKRADYKVDFQNVQFSGIIQGLSSGQYDAAISAMTITPERQQQVDFSDPYFNADQSLLVQKGSGIESTGDLGEATVGVESGTTGALKAQDLADQGKVGDVRTFNSVTDAFNALDNGQVNAVINDFPVSQDRVQQGKGLEIVQNIPTGEQYGIAFPKDSELAQPMNEALNKIKKDGTYAKIYKKWFDEKPQQIP